jgi:hypothetical protein
MMKTRFLVLISIATLFFAGKIAAQEVLVPLAFNPEQAADAARMASHRSAAAFPVDTVAFYSIGMRENFALESHRPDTALWELDPVYLTNAVGPGVYINRTWPMSPVNIGVCTFDGLKYNGEPYNAAATPNSTGRCDELVSRPIDLSKEITTPPNFQVLSVADSVYLSFWYQAGGRGYMPNVQDSILLDFNIPAWNQPPYDQFNMNWKNVWYKEGYNAGSDTSFHIVMIKLDSASYFTPGFRFRFRNYASQCGSNDHWHIDNIFMKSNRTQNDTVIHEVAFVYQMPSFIEGFQAMPADHYKPTPYMIDTIGITIRNNSTAARNCSYTCDVLDASGASIYTHPLATDGNLLPFTAIGYENQQTMSRPAIYPANYSSGFLPFGTNDTGFYIIRHKLLDGTIRVDSADFRQNFYNYYAYDDGTAEVGYGVYGQYSQLAVKFTMPSYAVNNDTLTAIQMYFLPVLDINNLQLREFTLKVWADGGNQPGAVIYSKQHQNPDYLFETPNRFISYNIDSFILQLTPSQTYYIGWEQQAIDRLYIGYDFNTDHSDKVYYNSTGNWQPSIFDGSPMIRPVFGKRYPIGEDATGLHENNALTFSVFPNPANDLITIAGLKNEGNALVSLFDISGREVMVTQQLNANGTLDVSQLSAGAYFVQLKKANGELIGTQRLIISR